MSALARNCAHAHRDLLAIARVASGQQCPAIGSDLPNQPIEAFV
jgi:hypothetical protein